MSILLESNSNLKITVNSINIFILIFINIEDTKDKYNIISGEGPI